MVQDVCRSLELRHPRNRQRALLPAGCDGLIGFEQPPAICWTAPASVASVPTSSAVPQSPAGFLPTSASFVSALTGWAVGTIGCPSGRCPALAATNTAGLTWNLDKPPPSGSVGVRFATDEIGYTWSARSLAVTLDAGQTWQESPERFSSISAVEIWTDRVLVTDAGQLYTAPVGTLSLSLASPQSLGMITEIADDPGLGADQGWAYALGPPGAGMPTWQAEPPSPPSKGTLAGLTFPLQSYETVLATSGPTPTLYQQRGNSWVAVAEPSTGAGIWHDLGFTHRRPHRF